MPKLAFIRHASPYGICCAGLLAMLAGCVQTPDEAQQPVAVVSTEPPPLLVRDECPNRYEVGLDDNIWDISAQCLDDPWRWPELWPGQDWPTLYPGDVIELHQDQGQPRMQLAEGERPTIKLSPEVRVEYIDEPVPTVTRDAIQGFVDNSVILSDAGWKGAPYVIGGADGRPLMVSGNRIYARGGAFDSARYGVYRPEGEYRHPDTGAFLGFNMAYVGEAVLEDEGDPATLRLVSSRREIRPGDRLLDAVEDQPVFDFEAVPAPPDSYGRVIDVLAKDPTLIGRYDTVAVSLGNLDGMRQGSVLAVYATDAPVTDPLTGATVDQPRERAGLIVLYKVFDRASYGLVTESRREIRINDLVREPNL